MIVYIVIAVLGMITLGLSIWRIDGLVESWMFETLHLTALVNESDNHRLKDNARLDEAFKRIHELEDRLEAQDAELTEHHNKIDTLEINGGIYESLFEQQGLWGESK